MQISFVKPDYKKLKKSGFLLADMHFHSNHSDGAATVQQIIEKARNMGIGISITDHNEISGVLEAEKLIAKEDFLIPGIEVKSSELIDILFYFPEINELKRFYNKEISMNKKRHMHTTKTRLPLKDLLEVAGKYDCMISAAHPFGYSSRGLVKDVVSESRDSFDKISVLEAMNGGSTRSENERSADYAKKNSKGATGGSDGHSIYTLGIILTCARAKGNRSFLEKIKSRESIVIGTEPLFSKVGEYSRFGVNKLSNMLKK